MVIESTQMYGMQVISNLLLLLMVAIAFYYALLSMPRRKKRWRILQLSVLKRGNELPPFYFKLLFIQKGSKGMEERKQLLLGCGMFLEPVIYEAIRRMFVLLLAGLTLLAYASFRNPGLALFLNPVYVLLISVSLLLFVLFDRKVLVQLKERRRHRIVKEIYTISQQLLYYSGSRMNLHAKLSRCHSQTRTLRSSFELLLNDWYQDAEAAIRSFKLRLGTDEAYSFGETLNALRQNEHEDYYHLLQQRITDYKEQIELTRESKKEAVSYMLFVLAGLPILNTFRVFMYPWILEGQQLFNSIN
ncbi:hypothetical protein [Paenibacillus eucommiae]|uniref:Type II secretion system protein GspF domain-containing protein n=1 Tax=Paenibacillus eucommiae TaxID=1355755 RepID=A0ABS4IUZ9_9BACL|nr:hypothetical protein [Paenibacillus eucommiae]MBP1990910.1 hypothetical protein [Paenibacillus eucommiae]